MGKLTFRRLLFFVTNHWKAQTGYYKGKKYNCHGYKINAILQYVKKIYLRLLAATEGTIFHIWPLSCPFITVKKHFDGNKRPGSACNKRGAAVAELSVCGATICLCSVVWSCHPLMASPYSSSTITSAFQLAFTRHKPNHMPVIKT